MKKAWRIVTGFGIVVATGCVSQRDGAPEGIEAQATLPSAEEVRAKEEAEARAQRQAFLTGELRWILENAQPHADASSEAAHR